MNKNKYKNINFLLLTIVLLINGFSLKAQVEDSVKLIGFYKVKNNTIKLRWNTKSGKDFFKVYQTGFEVKVFKKDNTNNLDSFVYRLKYNTPKNTLDTNNKSILTVYSALYNFEKMLPLNSKSSTYEIKEYNQNTEALWGMASFAADLDFKAAQLMGLGLEFDKPKNAEIFITISALGFKNQMNEELMFYINTNETEGLKETPKLITDENEKSIYLRWEHLPLNFTAYNFLRSESENGNFIKINKFPLLVNSKNEVKIGSYTDSLSINYKPYFYKIEGIDMFGDQYISQTPVVAMGRDRTPPQNLKNFEAKALDDSTVVLKWNFAENQKDDVYLVSIQRSLYTDSGYSEAKSFKYPNIETQFKDENLEKGRGFYYKIFMFDSVGNFVYSKNYCLLPDRISPQKPQNFEAKVNKKGIVKITWTLGTENDLKGYLLYGSFDKKSEFIGIVNRPFYDTVFYDTLSLKMLNKDVFYKLVAVDFNFNKSKETDIIKVIRPDTIPPLAPIITNYLSTDSGIYISWNPSSSFDVKKMVLFKVNPELKDTLKIVFDKPEIASYFDKNSLSQQSFIYFLKCYDFDDNVSKSSNQVQLKTLTPALMPSFEQWAIQYDTILKQVNIKWDKSLNTYKNCKVVVYKGPDSTQMTLFKTIDFSAGNIQDNKFFQGEIYYYKIYLVFLDKRKTLFSKTRTIRLE